MLAGKRQQLGAVLRHHFLVGSNDELAAHQCLAQVAVRRLLATDHLDDQLDRRIVEQRRRISRHDARVQRTSALLRDVTHQRAPDLQREANLPRVDVGFFVQDARDAGADDAQPHQPNANRLALTGHCRRAPLAGSGPAGFGQV